jgi:hypothetical protein
LAFSLGGVAAAAGIFGRVVNAQTREPVRRAIVRVYSAKGRWDEFTDGEGRFTFPSLMRGEYSLIAHRDGFTDRSYKVELSDFDNPMELPIELRPQGLITGRVVDGSGQPLQGARIEALNTQASGAQVQPVSLAETDDLGDYRLAGLDPGAYRLRVTYRAGRESEFDSTPITMATSFFGGSERPTELAVKSGSVTGGIDFVLIAVAPVTVHGTLHTEAGVLSEPVTLWIAGQDGEGGHNGSGRDGAFEIRDVGPGTYAVSAQTLNKSTRLFGTALVKVRDADVDGIDIILRPSPKLEGQIRAVDGSLPDLKIGSILFQSQTPGIGLGLESAKLDENGNFALPLNPGEYTVSFDSRFSDVQRVTLDEKPVTNWKIQMDPGAESKKLVILVKRKAQK